MKVIRADVLGFCGGVRRAVTAAEKALNENKSGTVYTLGPLIHNPVALNELASRGLRVLVPSAINTLVAEDTVLIRAHGVSPSMENELRSKCKSVINATCPLVTQSQKRAAAFAEKGYTIVFAGDKNHGEVVGIQGYAEEAAAAAGKTCEFLLIRTAEEARELFVSEKPEHVVLLSQTTFSIKEWESICAVLQEKIPTIEIFSTICPATHERQDALVRLCAHVDGVIVIGGKNSSNTNRLFTTAQKLCAHAALIETADEIPSEFYQLQTVGITAGASTPDSVIDAVENLLLN
ncbi:MAG: 4-hydroxy-3-methylbut-2-enyl diphosphate reductase [Treponema sp.]|nr:4-hydroxy-3-methylbut-2-enyl diphosphate reductase [Treponema sp.]